MKIKNIKYVALAAVFGMGATSCDDFLDRPTEDNYNQSNFYQNDTQCVQGVNFLYNSPWYDFQRGFFKVGEVMSGNYYWGEKSLSGFYSEWNGPGFGQYVLFFVVCYSLL